VPSDYFGEIGGIFRIGDVEPCAKIIPKGDAEFGTGLGDAEEGVAADAPVVTACAAADLALGDMEPDVVFRAVGVEWDFWAMSRASSR
jgi:hypothetical protein